MTFPSFTTGEVLRAADMNAVGLWLVKTQTIGTAVSSVVVTGAFSADYDNYLIQVSGGTGSTAGGVSFRLSNSSGSTYSAAGTYGNYGVNSAVTYNPAATTQWTDCIVVNSVTYSASVFLSSPFANRPTTGYTDCSSSASFYKFSLIDTSTNSSTGFTLTPIFGTLTGGTIRVYGYRN